VILNVWSLRAKLCSTVGTRLQGLRGGPTQLRTDDIPVAYVEFFFRAIGAKIVYSAAHQKVFVACVATIFVVGPVTDFIGRAIANGLTALLATVPLVAGFLIGALWPCLIIFGMHWGFIPVIMSNIGTLGYDVILPITVGTNFAVGTAALAVFLKTKNPELKETAAASTISALLAGITEPAIYGVVLKYKRPFVIMALSCGICGAIAATGGLTQAALMTTCVLTIPAIGGMVGWLDVVALAVASVLTFVGTLAFGFSDKMLLEEEK